MSVIFERNHMTVDEQHVGPTPVLWVQVYGGSLSSLNRDDALDLYGALHRWLRDTDPHPRRKPLGPRGI